MEVENHKIIRSFITKEDAQVLIKWIEEIPQKELVSNFHLTSLAKALNGSSYIFDVSKTDLTRYVTDYQRVNLNSEEGVPDLVYRLIDRISKTLRVSTDHVFFQAVDMHRGGMINPHYDASLEGYINYKCNLCILSEEYEFFFGDSKFRVGPGDLYCFEASLYKHWTAPFNSRRVFMSFGFMIPYRDLGREEEDPRVRLSRRIEKYFQRRISN